MESSSKPSVLFRSVVVVSSTALLLGVVGIFYFQGLDRDATASRPRDACIVMVEGLPPAEAVALRAHWINTEGKAREELGEPLPEPGHWLLRSVPEGSPVQIQIVQQGEDRTHILHRQPAVLTRGGVFEIRLPTGR